MGYNFLWIILRQRLRAPGGFATLKLSERRRFQIRVLSDLDLRSASSSGKLRMLHKAARG
jgi:hypothetical protein